MRLISLLFVITITLYSYGNASQKEAFIKAYEISNYRQCIELAEEAISQNSQNLNAWYYKALAEKALYKYYEACVSIEKTLALSSETPELLYLLGSTYALAGNSVKSINLYKQVILIDSTHVPAMSSLAKLYLNNKEYVKAINLYSNLVKLDTTNGYFYSQLAFCCKKFGLTEPVIDYYNKALKLNPTDFESCKRLVSEYINRKYYEQAIELADSFLLKFPENIYLLKQKAFIAAIGGNYLDAVTEFKHVVELGDSSMFTCKYYGQSLFNNGEYNKAIYWLNRYVKANKDDIKNQYILALAYQKDYQYRQSLQHFHLALGLVFDKKLIATVYEEMGNTYAKYGDYMGFRDSLASGAQEMYKLANDNYLLAFDLVPANFEMYRTFGRFYEEKLKDKRMALYYYQKYYDEHDSHKIYEHDLIWVQNKITRLTEDLHFMGN